MTAFDAPPVRGAVPHAVVEEAVLGDWSTTTWEGREGRVSVRFHDAGERPLRLRAAIEAGEAAVCALPPAIGDGWRVVRLRVARSRVAKSGDRWIGTSEFLVRMWRQEEA